MCCYCNAWLQDHYHLLLFAGILWLCYVEESCTNCWTTCMLPNNSIVYTCINFPIMIISMLLSRLISSKIKNDYLADWFTNMIIWDRNYIKMFQSLVLSSVSSNMSSLQFADAWDFVSSIFWKMWSRTSVLFAQWFWLNDLYSMYLTMYLCLVISTVACLSMIDLLYLYAHTN